MRKCLIKLYWKITTEHTLKIFSDDPTLLSKKLSLRGKYLQHLPRSNYIQLPTAMYTLVILEHHWTYPCTNKNTVPKYNEQTEQSVSSFHKTEPTQSTHTHCTLHLQPAAGDECELHLCKTVTEGFQHYKLFTIIALSSFGNSHLRARPDSGRPSPPGG